MSEVTGELEQGVSNFDLLRLLPGRDGQRRAEVRAMQIISDLEGHRRGPYAGAIGYFLPDGPMDTCIAIRTIVSDGVAHLQAGAGIVADSSPSAEHDKCLRAGRARARDRPSRGPLAMLLIDNDSFTYNLAHLFGELGAEVEYAGTT